MAQAQDKARRQGLSMIPDDIGLMPDTFIPPSDPLLRNRFSVRRYWLKRRFQDLTNEIVSRWYLRKLKPGFDRSKVVGIARDLHKRMYQAFSSGNLENDRDVISAGLATSLQKRIDKRGPAQYYEWEIVSRPQKPKLITYRAFALPRAEGSTEGMDKNGLIQAVVKIRTKQRLQRMERKHQNNRKKAQGTTVVSDSVEAQPLEKETTEYVVISKQIKDGTVGLWKIWGFAQEATLKDIDKGK